MIVVTGATGQLGGAIIEGLLKRMAAGRIVASVRNPAKAAALTEQGVHVRAGDFAEPTKLAAAFVGATAVLITSVNQLGEEAVRMHDAAIKAAYAAGAHSVLYTSHMGARADSPFVPAENHAATEAIFASIGKPFTALRHATPKAACIWSAGGSRQGKSARRKMVP